MVKSKSKWGNQYTPEFKQQMVELVRAGRAPKQLSREFGCSYWSIQSWVKQADRDTGRGNGGLTSAERQELTRLKRENRQLKEEREILSKAAAWFAQERRVCKILCARHSMRTWRSYATYQEEPGGRCRPACHSL